MAKPVLTKNRFSLAASNTHPLQNITNNRGESSFCQIGQFEDSHYFLLVFSRFFFLVITVCLFGSAKNKEPFLFN